ncbi:hypothetical protein J2R98_002402 [Alkalibacillus filiformis]|uniref:Uncharacterized protein n=1 Tax=Alkalibacillus filiformis TaxID=200990 RepID=A0ABU0DWM4_9BACI|nr:hypothetical protein [Alkalibacillus filiformis]
MSNFDTNLNSRSLDAHKVVQDAQSRSIDAHKAVQDAQNRSLGAHKTVQKISKLSLKFQIRQTKKAGAMPAFLL